MDYPVTLTPDDNGTVLVTFPDVDGAVTFGDTIAEALARAPDALATILEAYIKDRRPIPPPSTRRTKHRVAVPALIEAKIRLYEAMRVAKVGKAELGRPTMLERVRGYAREAGRGDNGIPFEGRINLATGNPEEWQKSYESWRSLGASHLSVNTMGCGFMSVDQHVQRLREVKQIFG